MTATTDTRGTKDPALLEAARKAVGAYLAALDRAEATASAARTALQAAGLSGLPPLYLRDYRLAAQRIHKRLPTPEQYTAPTHRRVRLANGVVGSFTIRHVREFHRDGLVVEWLDGLPPEQPAPEQFPSGPKLETGALPSSSKDTSINSERRSPVH